MRFPLRFGIVMFLVGSATAHAAEPIAEFLQGLRGRGYVDLAIDYIELNRKHPPFSGELQSMFLLESGITYAQASTLAVDTEQQNRWRAEARKDLRAFLKASPSHPRAMQAQSILGQLLLYDGTFGFTDGGLYGKTDQLDRIRGVIQESRGYLSQSRDHYHELWRQYPSYIPEEQVEIRRQKRAIEESYIRTQLDLAQCTYWEAQTYPVGSDESRRLSAEAGLEFEAIHQRYRSLTGGLLARLFQARCFQNQNDAQGVRIALGIYAELLEHHGDSPTIVDLRDRALKFRLTCLNSEFRKDYQLVIQEAEEWLDDSSDRAVSHVGIAIQWELCTALEAKGNSLELSEEERLNFLQQAYHRAYPLTWIKGIYAQRANALMERIKPLLEKAGRSTDPAKPSDPPPSADV